MPVTKHEMKGNKMFTKQDYLDGKCTKDGLPLKGADNAPNIKKAAGSPERIPNAGGKAKASGAFIPNANTTTSGPDTSSVDIAIDDKEDPSAEIENGDSSDSK